MAKKKVDPAGKVLSKAVETKLAELGIDLTAICGEGGMRAAKVVCVATDLSGSLKELAGAARDQVVMVRVDEETRRQLDAWVETGSVKSRSEAAALFIREGLKLREGELDGLAEALDEVEKAKKRLHKKAARVFGG